MLSLLTLLLLPGNFFSLRMKHSKLLSPALKAGGGAPPADRGCGGGSSSTK